MERIDFVSIKQVFQLLDSRDSQPQSIPRNSWKNRDTNLREMRTIQIYPEQEVTTNEPGHAIDRSNKNNIQSSLQFSETCSLSVSTWSYPALTTQSQDRRMTSQQSASLLNDRDSAKRVKAQTIRQRWPITNVLRGLSSSAWRTWNAKPKQAARQTWRNQFVNGLGIAGDSC